MERTMAIDRRLFVTAAAALLAMPSKADNRLEYLEYPFRDYFSPQLRGRNPSRATDIEAANRIATSMPKSDHFEIMQRLSKIEEAGSTDELFNARWKTFANPLIVRFFHDIGYKKTPYPGDCTPWCAATTSWCLQRAGLSIPADPASSQSFLRYGTRVSDPRPGDLCVFTDVNDKAHGHVGMFVSTDGASLKVLGGNQSGQSVSNCGPGYRQSKIDIAEIPINSRKERSAGIHYLAAYVRPA
jgi:uncharacterized protein (TIGR02594 family)